MSYHVCHNHLRLFLKHVRKRMIFIYQETLTLTNSMIITSLPSHSTYFRPGAYLKF